MNDVFAGLADEVPARAIEARTALLKDAKRGFTKVRKVFVQLPDIEPDRASVLGSLVHDRQEKALDALLLLLALEPILREQPLRLAAWANLLSSAHLRCTSATAARAFEALAERNLVTRARKGRFLEVYPLLEDGSGRAWDSPGSNPATVGKGYFTIPDAYWSSGLVDRLNLPGKAMFLIALSETSKKTSFEVATTRVQKWYGISERTAERGYQELRQENAPDGAQLLREHRQMVKDARSPIGVRAVWHRALADPYSRDARRRLQRRSVRATVRRAAKNGSADASTGMPSTTNNKTTARKKTSGAPARRTPAASDSTEKGGTTNYGKQAAPV